MNPRVILVGTAATGAAVVAMLDAAAKAGLLLAAAALVVWVLGRKASASTRHLVWLCALTGALLLPLSFRLLPQWRILPAWMCWEEVPRLFSAPRPPAPVPSVSSDETTATAVAMPEAAPSPRPAARPTAGKPASPPPRPLRVKARIVLGIWAAGGLLCLLPLGASLVKLRRVSKRARRLTDDGLLATITAVANEIGLRRMPRILLGKNPVMPMVWGVFRPSLLLPECATAWPARRLRSVLLHELCHLRRRDPLTLVVAHLAVAVHWFNPLAWIALAGIRREQELACDDCVLRHGIPSSGYAEEMLAITTDHPVAAPAGALAMARPSGLETRITTILDPGRNRRATTRRLVAVATGLALLVGLPVAVLRATPTGPDQRGRLLDRNGLVLADNAPDGKRRYPYGALAPHLIGYINPVESRGVCGVEQLFDESLSQGREVKLTLDARLQHHAETVLRNVGIGRGAVVVMDCANGDLLASVSVPSFDPNDFVPRLSKENWKAYLDNKADPLANRTLTAYTPGSAFKLLTALAACRAGHAADHHTCDGFVTYGNIKIGCWVWNQNKGRHGDQTLHDAIIHSCNPFFMQTAEAIGPEKLAETGSMLGFGQATGCGLSGESAGIMPSPEDSKKRHPDRKWGPIETANTAIGQGESLATPLQLAALAAGLGSGRIFVPRLDQNSPPRLRLELAEAGWKTDDLATIRSAMRDNVQLPNGTAPRARSTRVEIAGVTGTCQIMDRGQRSHNAIFVGYAPASAPQFAIAVVVQNGGSGGKVSAPLARMILEGLSAELPMPKPLAKAKGHLERIEEVRE